MPRWKLVLSYDGTRYNGWQRQPTGRTVEGEIERCLETLYQQPIDLIGQGRTDAGVHALHQVAHFDLPDTLSPDRFLNGLQSLLPDDIAMVGTEEVEETFHARFDAVSRSYIYSCTTARRPLQRHMEWYIPNQPDVLLLNRCAEAVLGRYDFINFCIPPEGEKATTICEIVQSEWVQEGESLTYHIEGNRFLRHLVRRLVGTMMQVATGALTLEEFTTRITGPEISQKGHAAPPHGLLLSGVRYPITP
ncbi:MAG: tRNA pseudouridine(38-40) synthase TruA [Balneolaceae bacterium]